MKRIVLSMLLCCGISLGVFSQNLAPLRSKVFTDTIKSEILKTERPYTIYLPESYEDGTNNEYPVLYILHGLLGNNTSWFSDMRLQDVIDLLSASGEADEMIIVSPHAGGNPAVEQNGYFNMPGWPYEDFFFQEFMPTIESQYRIKADKGHRAVAGLSMGGGGSTVYAQHHPELFGSVYAMSALMNIPGDNPVNNLPDPEDKMAKLNQSVIENSCIAFVENADEATKENLRSVAWFVDCGDDDFLLDRNIEFVQAMKKAGIPLQFRVRDGAHNSEYWHSALYHSLPFASRHFKK
ncbi:MAG: esterase family protein [Muribaculaceae bacterium]|nr:esterase family protein [Muribaculaceae bacterium]